MDKIKAVFFAFQYSDGTWHDGSATKHDCGMKSLYTDDALQAVAEAVNEYWLVYCDNRSEMEMPDLTTIINQLKGHIPSKGAS